MKLPDRPRRDPGRVRETTTATWSVPRRLVAALVIVVVGGGAGLFWAGSRAGAVVDAEVRDAVTAFVDPDGRVQVVESLVVETAPPRGVIERIVPLEPGQGARLRGVTENGEAVPASAVPVPDGVLLRVATGRRLSVLRITYDLTDVTELGGEAALLHLRLADRRNPLAFTGLSVDVSWLEGAGPPLDVVLEAEGASDTVVDRPGGLRWEAGAIAAHRPIALEAAIGAVALSELTPGGADPVEAMAEREDNTARATNPFLDVVLPVLLAVLFLGTWALAHARRGREPDVGGPLEQRVAPARTPPAELGWLLRFGAVTDADLAATLVDLHRRRHLHLDASGDAIHRVLPEPADPLRPADRVVRDWLLPAGVDSVRVGDVTAAIQAGPTRWQRMWQGFVDAVDAGGAVDGLIERRVGSEAVLALGLSSAAVLCAGVIGMATGRPWWLALVVAGAVVVVFADTFARRSPAGADLAARWLQYRVHLAGYAGLQRDPDAAMAVADALPWLPALDLHDVAATAGPDAAPLEHALAAVKAWHGAYLHATSFLALPAARRTPARRR